mgnify:CR=1 FL=1
MHNGVLDDRHCAAQPRASGWQRRWRSPVMGIVLGLARASPATQQIGSQLFGVQALDPVTHLAVTVLLLAVMLWASLIPARRAASISPVEALRLTLAQATSRRTAAAALEALSKASSSFRFVQLNAGGANPRADQHECDASAAEAQQHGTDHQQRMQPLDIGNRERQFDAGEERQHRYDCCHEACARRESRLATTFVTHEVGFMFRRKACPPRFIQRCSTMWATPPRALDPAASRLAQGSLTTSRRISVMSSMA